MLAQASARTRWISGMPKAELHLHLDGSLRPETALELAHDRDIGIDAETLTVAEMRALLVAPEECGDQAELLRAFELPTALLQDEEALRRVTNELVEDVASDGTHYAEIRWAPSLHTDRGLSLHDGIAAVVESARSAADAAGITVRLIAVALRTHPPQMAVDVAHASLAFVDAGLTGFDLAGVERDAPDPRAFAGAFDIAREGGLGISCHAGEWGGAAQVRASLTIRPWRIAHGAPAADDPSLCADLRHLDVTLDLCPTSNRQAGYGSADRDAPLARLLRADVPVTINTDDRTVSDLTLITEIDRAMAQMGIEPAQVVAMMRRAHAVAFLHHDEASRARLLEDFEAWVALHPAPD